MKGYESIPSTDTTVDEQGLSSSAFDNSRRRRLSDDHHPFAVPLSKWTIVTATVTLLVLAITFTAFDSSSNSNNNGIEELDGSSSGSSLRSASVVMLPNPPAQVVPSTKIYNNNPHVKLLGFDRQRVNHFRDDNYDGIEPVKYWTQPYYKTTQYFQGPGSPIFCIIGGEAYEDRGFIYPFISETLAQYFGAAVVQPEHRFYGVKKPVDNATKEELLELLTVPQALADVVAFLQHFADELGCNIHDKTSSDYCPVITVGGSYGGFLSAMARIVYPDFIDMAYSGSGPIRLYGQLVDDPNVYYDILTKAYDHSSPGCAKSIKDTLYTMKDTILHTVASGGTLAQAAEAVGVCPDIPAYIETPEVLADALVAISSSRFHDANLFSYPPGKDTAMYKICSIFQYHEVDPLKDFFFTLLDPPTDFGTAVAPSDECFDLKTQVPKDGVTVSDTPDDVNHDGIVWDFQVCTDLCFIFGYSDKSMLPPKNATYAALTEHCRGRFGVTPRPWELVERYEFGDLASHSNILFTNGMQDIWSGGGITWNVSDTVLSLFFPNGAHHSDLSRGGPSDNDTDDIKYGYIQIKNILGKWLDAIGK